MLGLRDARRVVWRRRGGNWLEGYLTLGDDGLRLTGRVEAKSTDVSLTITARVVGRVEVGMVRDGRRGLERAAVLELTGQEPIEIVLVDGGALELEQLARRLSSVLALRQLPLAAES